MSEVFDSFRDVFVPVFGFVFLFGPWPLAVWMSVSLAQQRGRKYGFCFFLVLAVVMGAVYFGGLITASDNAAQDHPGRAAMATGAAVVYSYGILLVALIVRCRLGLKKTPLNAMTAVPKRRLFRATGYPVFEMFFVLLILTGAALALVLPILQWLFR